MQLRRCAWSDEGGVLWIEMTEEHRLETKATRSNRFSIPGTNVAALRALNCHRSYGVNAPHRSAERYQASQVPKSEVIVMLNIIGALALLALFANSERFRRDDLEKVEVRLATSSIPQPR